MTTEMIPVRARPVNCPECFEDGKPECLQVLLAKESVLVVTCRNHTPSSTVLRVPVDVTRIGDEE